MALISVIIPVYNKAPWLAECLESILLSAGDALEQLEIILVDDGSTDGSGEICRDYAGDTPRFSCLKSPMGAWPLPETGGFPGLPGSMSPG